LGHGPPSAARWLEARACSRGSGRDGSLANKECLVAPATSSCSGAATAGACILPADSEHNALFQALSSEIGKNWSA